MLTRRQRRLVAQALRLLAEAVEDPGAGPEEDSAGEPTDEPEPDPAARRVAVAELRRRGLLP